MVSQPVCLDVKPPSVAQDQIFMSDCCRLVYVGPPLWQEDLVGRLQLLLALANAIILRSESRGTHDDILLSQIRDSPNLEARSLYLYPPGTGWPIHVSYLTENTASLLQRPTD
jgi:hypothetical protein